MKKKTMVTMLVLTIMAGLVGTASAERSYLTSFNTTYGTSTTVLNSCNLCHPGGDTGSLNSYANAYANANYNFAAIANLDSDGDGFTNAVEIAARTFPGDAASRPAATDTTAPAVSGFAIPTSSTSLTVSITTFTATDSVGVTGYRVTETSAIPAASAAGWTTAAPASYTFASAGAKTLYAWAKDAAGNVSAPLSRTTTITLPDTTAPAVTGFTIPVTSTSLTVAITTFIATDGVGVTGYRVTESPAIPAASATGWSAAAPANYTFASAGAKTLYAWAKDAAGNVSAPLSDTTTISLPDATAPTVTGFAIPPSATSLTVPITTFTASDNTGVAGYLVTETSTIPQPSAAGWSAAVPANYTFASAGAKTLYAWAKDAAGNVSAPLSDTATISLPDATAPVVTGFAIPASSTSLIVAITLTATDNTGVTGYMVTENPATPTAAAAGWSAAAPASYTFASAGAKTLYAWVKDAAGNVDGAISGIVITVSDTTAPAITGFAIPATSESLTVAISTFTATDNTGVTGYMATENATAPAAAAAGWSAVAPASYTFASAGAKTLHAWVKDAAGNVGGAIAGTVITIPSDSQIPIIVTFEIPSRSLSRTIPVGAFTATDDVGVTGYIVTDSPVTPSLNSPGWSSTPPASYTFGSTTPGGIRRIHPLYAWVKDAAGNISAAVVRVVSFSDR